MDVDVSSIAEDRVNAHAGTGGNDIRDLSRDQKGKNMPRFSSQSKRIVKSLPLEAANVKIPTSKLPPVSKNLPGHRAAGIDVRHPHQGPEELSKLDAGFSRAGSAESKDTLPLPSSRSGKSSNNGGGSRKKAQQRTAIPPSLKAAMLKAEIEYTHITESLSGQTTSRASAPTSQPQLFTRSASAPPPPRHLAPLDFGRAPSGGHFSRTQSAGGHASDSPAAVQRIKAGIQDLSAVISDFSGFVTNQRNARGVVELYKQETSREEVRNAVDEVQRVQGKILMASAAGGILGNVSMAQKNDCGHGAEEDVEDVPQKNGGGGGPQQRHSLHVNRTLMPHYLPPGRGGVEAGGSGLELLNRADMIQRMGGDITSVDLWGQEGRGSLHSAGSVASTLCGSRAQNEGKKRQSSPKDLKRLREMITTSSAAQSSPKSSAGRAGQRQETAASSGVNSDRLPGFQKQFSILKMQRSIASLTAAPGGLKDAPAATFDCEADQGQFRVDELEVGEGSSSDNGDSDEGHDKDDDDDDDDDDDGDDACLERNPNAGTAPDYIILSGNEVDESPEMKRREMKRSLEHEIGQGHPAIALLKRLMNMNMAQTFEFWNEWHTHRMREKFRVMKQYRDIAARRNCLAITTNALRSFVFKPSSEHLDLANLGLGPKDVDSLFSVFAPPDDLVESEAFKASLSLHKMRVAMGDSGLRSIDVAHNGMGAKGLASLARTLEETSFFRADNDDDDDDDDPEPIASPSKQHIALNGGGTAPHLMPPAPEMSTSYIATLTSLNISYNSLGPSGAVIIAKLLERPGCFIARLDCSGNGLEDRGCAGIAKALQAGSRATVRELRMSHNAAGQDAGAEIGRMLSSNNSIEILDLHFNHIRGKGARLLCAGLVTNRSLKQLLVGWNGVGDPSTIKQLSKAISSTACVLRVLDLSHSRLGFQSALLLGKGVEDSAHLTMLVLDGNPIGQSGARSLMRAVHRREGSGRDSGEMSIHVSTLGCGVGIVDNSAFDPAEPSGDYELDLTDSYSSRVLFSLLGVALQGKGEFITMDDKGRNVKIDGWLLGKATHNEVMDEEEWGIVGPNGVFLPLQCEQNGLEEIPLAVTWQRILKRKQPMELVCSFKYTSLRERAKDGDRLSTTAYDRLLVSFTRPEVDAKEVLEVIDTVLDSDAFITFEQVESLVKESRVCTTIRDVELQRARATLVARAYHKLVDAERSRELIQLLKHGPERQTAEKMLGPVSFAFTYNNPTGYYRLDLADASQREICLRLLDFRNELGARIQQLKSYSSGRLGGRREDEHDHADLERVWRNGKLNGNPMRYMREWQPPFGGILELDFVEVTKPDPLGDVKDAGYEEMSEIDFQRFLYYLNKEAADDPAKQVSLIRKFSNTGFSTCCQLARLIDLFDAPNLRVEVIVIGFARKVNWHGLNNVTFRLTLTERRQLHARIGLINLFDESMAVDYYELDLANPAQRWVMQEIIHLAAAEPGNNMVGCTLDGIDFSVPSGWLQDPPRKGVVSFYYCREQRVIETCLVQGAWDSKISPMHVRDTGTLFEEETHTSFTPKWLREFCHSSPNEWPAPSPQPFDTAWVRPYRMRRIKLKMYEKHPEAETMFAALDRDGGGSLDRKELAVGLFSLGIWLHPCELAALLEALDQDGGGNIDLEEFQSFWSKYSFE